MNYRAQGIEIINSREIARAARGQPYYDYYLCDDIER